MNTPVTISFIVPALNSASSIGRTIDSIKRQSVHSGTEIIVVDNGSQDETLKLSQEAGAICLKEAQKGAGNCREAGIRVSRGEFLAFVDSDVILSPDWLQRAMIQLEDSLFDVVQGPNVPCSQKQDFMLKARSSLISEQTAGTFNYLERANAGLPQINTAAVMMRKRWFSEKGIHFDSAFQRCEDTDLSIQLFFSGANFASVEGMESQVSDNRSPLAYIYRSWLTGRNLSLVTKKWNLPPGHQRQDCHEKNLIHKMFRSANRLAFRLGFIFGKKNILPVTLGRLDNPRQSFAYQLGEANTTWVLSPFCRIVLLKDSAVLYELRSGARLVLDKNQRDQFLLWRKEFPDEQNELLKKLINEKIFVSFYGK